jgi:hypothetical protein
MLRQGVRTVHRWELSGLPVHRVEDGGLCLLLLRSWMHGQGLLQRGTLIRCATYKVKSLKAEVRSLKAQLKQRSQEIKGDIKLPKC